MPIHGTSHNGYQNITSLLAGKVTDSGELSLTGEQTFSTTGTSNDVALNGGVSVFRFTGASGATITGFTGGYLGRILFVVNETGNNLTLSHLVTSAAANQIVAIGSSGVVIGGTGGAVLRYDGTKWRILDVATNTFGGNATVGGTFTAQGALSLSNSGNPGSLSGTTNDWAPTAAFRQRITATAAAIITGLSSGAGTTGRWNWFQNISSFNVTLTNEGAGSTAANRFTCPRNVDLVIPPGGNAYLIYDTTTSRWIVFGDASCWSQGASTLSGDLTAPPMAASRYYYAPNGVVSTSAVLVNGNFRAARRYIPNTVTVTRIGAEITSAGDAGSKLRLGIYGDDGTGRPGALILDAGTIAADSATVQEITGLTTTIGPGWYWFGAAVQLVTVTQPTVRTTISGDSFVDFEASVSGSAPTTGLTAQQGVIMTGVTGALPGTFTLNGNSAATPRIFIKT